ncbi:MAG: hypothetical protein GX616_07795, partial [Planctomycetes bacterium]|nr:hypothetical protein [Planctomycetota bacterium]
MAGGDNWVRPQAGTLLAIQKPALDQVLSKAPIENGSRVRDSAAVITLPRPDGSFERFAFVESSVLAPHIATQVPEIRTFVGQGIDNPSATARFDLTPLGFHAQVLAPSDVAGHGRQSFFIDPAARGDTANYISYAAADTVATGPWECSTANADTSTGELAAGPNAPEAATVTRHV